MLETRQRAVIWLAFAVGASLAALLQRPGQEPTRGALTSPVPPPEFVVETKPDRNEGPYARAIAVTAMRHNLDPALVQAVIEAESGYNPEAVSAAGAVGLMQTLPETAALMGLPQPADPAASLEAGCRYLAALRDMFGGDVELALAAYNAGPGAVRRWGTVPPYRETRTFVSRVAETYRRLTGLDIGTSTLFTSDVSMAF